MKHYTWVFIGVIAIVVILAGSSRFIGLSPVIPQALFVAGFLYWIIMAGFERKHGSESET